MNKIISIGYNGDDARELTAEQASAYKPTGKSPKKLVTKKARVMPKKETIQEQLKRIYIRMHSSDDTQQLINLKETITAAPGDTEVVLVLGNDSDRQAIRLPQRTSASDENIALISDIVGSNNVRLN
jgi:hypothetical protein